MFNCHTPRYIHTQSDCLKNAPIATAPRYTGPVDAGQALHWFSI
jgi:hypothetical protein